MSAQGNLACLDTKSGKQVWGIKMSDFGGSVPKWGYAESPLVDGDLVVCTPGGDECTMLAVNKATGKVAWKSEAFSTTLGNGDVVTANAHYSSVLPVEQGGKRQYIQLTVLAVVGVDASNGKTLWQIPFPGRVAVIPSPIFDDGNVYVSAGYGVGSKLIELSDDNKAVEKWYTKAMQNHHGSVIKVGDYFYGSSAKTFTCQSAKDGSAVWNERKIKKGAVTYADGLFYHIQESDGKVLLMDASPDGMSIKGSFVLSPQNQAA